MVLDVAGFRVDMTGFGIRYDHIWCRMRLDLVLGMAGLVFGWLDLCLVSNSNVPCDGRQGIFWLNF